LSEISEAMPTGTVKWFNPDKGYGFIKPDDGTGGVFMHASALKAAGMDTLREGQKLSYELEPGRSGRMAAGKLIPV
jgi:cold shock protein